MIPKVIHYCWFGGKQLPKLARKCIESWKKFLPEYEIKEWNESNFDVNIIPFTAAAYAERKYAFVSDYARFWILYRYGGVYFDTDVEVVKPIDDIVEQGAFMGIEAAVRPVNRKFGIASGLGMASEVGHPIFEEIIELYNHSVNYGARDDTGRMMNVVDIVTSVFSKYGWQDSDVFQKCAGTALYPTEFFCPMVLDNEAVRIVQRDNTRTIHHYAGSWLPRSYRFKDKMARFVGPELTKFIIGLKRCFLCKK